MVKKSTISTHKTCFKALQSTKNILSILCYSILMLILCVNMVSSMDFDNSKSYDLNKKEVTITNAFGLGKELFKAELITPHNVQVIDRGSGILQKVGEFKITNMDKKDFKNTFGKIKTLNNFNGKITNKDVVYKYRIKVGEYSYPVQETTCPENYKSKDECETIEVERRTVEQYDWVEFNKFKDLPEGEIVIGVFVDVEPKESGEWIPTFYGIEVDEWAGWNTGLDNGLLLYAKFDETSGTNAVDSSNGTQNGTISGADVGVEGILGTAFNISGKESVIYNISMLRTYHSATISIWVRNQYWNNNGYIWSYIDSTDSNPDVGLRYVDGTNKINVAWNEGGDTNAVNTAFSPTLNEWNHYVVQGTDSGSGNLTVWVNGEIKGTDETITAYIGNEDANHHSVGNGTAQVINGSYDEFAIWGRYLTPQEVIDLYNGGAGIAYGEYEVETTLSSPDNATKFLSSNNISFVVNTSTGNANLINVTLNIDGVANETINITGTDNLTTFTKNLGSLSLGLHSWNATGCDNIGCFNSNETRWINLVNYIVNSETYNNITTEGATEIFGINFTKISSLQVSTLNLVYNGTKNSFPYTVTGNEVISESTFAIPTKNVSTNVSFFWNIIFSDSTSYNTSIHNQTINILNIDNCTSYSNLIYNFSQYDEESKAILSNNNTMEIQMNLYNTDKSLLLINFSQKFQETNPTQICLENSLLNNVNYSSYVVVKYYANLTTTNESYSVEYYNILNQTINNNTVPKNIKLYSLKETDTTKFRLTFRDEYFNLASNILVQVHRQYIADNDFKIVEIPLTDSSGQTILNLVRSNIVYNIIMVNEAGNVIATFNSIKAFCQDFTIGDCTINLNADSIAEDIYNRDEDFSISITNLTYSNGTELVSLSFITNDLLPKTVRIDVLRNNAFGNRSVCSNSLTSASGLLTCDVSSITDTDQFLFTDIYVDGKFFSKDTINLNASTLKFGTVNGAFYAFLLILFLVCLFMEDRKVLIISLGLGWVVVISLGLINGKFVGSTSAGIWILVSIVIMLWKLNNEESQ